MNKYVLEFKPMGHNAILIEWPNEVSDRILDDILQYMPQIIESHKESMCNYATGYNSILVHYKHEIDYKQKSEALRSLYHRSSVQNTVRPKTWTVPVCYDEEFGPDLSLYLTRGLSIDEVIALHTEAPYRVYMIGFLPGFLYLGGLQNELHLSRKDNPRQSVPKGSIAIGGKQTGIYPNDSPGGWQIIGRTPITLFDITQDVPISIKQGDYIQFNAIDRSTYENLSI